MTLDEELLRQIDALEEVKEKGRSALFRRLAQTYLQQLRNHQIRLSYQKGYGANPVVEGELDLTPEYFAWPDD